MFKFCLYKLGQFFVNVLPLNLAYRFAEVISDFQYAFSPRDRKAVRNNLKSIPLEGDALKKAVRCVFRNFGGYLVEFFTMAKTVDSDYIREKIQIINREALDQTLERGKGAVIVAAHIGNWELGAIVLSQLGYPTMAVALPHKERPVNNLFNKQREAKGIEVVPNNIAVRRCIEQLRSNKLVAIVGDRPFGAKAIKVKFLDKDAMIPQGAAIFSYKTGAPIVPCFMIRQEDRSFTMTLYDPIYPSKEPGMRHEAIIKNIIEQYTKIIETQIRKYPSQWLMFREYWNDK